MTKQTIAPGARLHRLGGEKGPDLVLIHGFGADRYSWLATAPAWFGTHQVWALELPAHGDAGPLAGSGDPAGIASSIAQCLPQLKWPFALVGHSLGAAITLHLAKLLPQALSHLVLIAPAGLGQSLDGEFMLSFARLKTSAETEALLHRLVNRSRLINPQMAAHVLASLAIPGRREALSLIARSLIDARPEKLPGNIPTLVIWGDADIINPADESLQASLGHRFVMLANVGHMPQVEAPTKVSRLISEVLKE